jgi:WD40 repeat protein/beta-lactamase regulating signal transducer with metallopeptidase domain
MFFGSTDAIESAAGWMALAAVPIAFAATAGLALASIVRRDPASRHAILALALVAVCGSPFGLWFAHRAGWSLFILPRSISQPNPVALVASPTDRRVQLADANPIDRLAPRDVADIASGSAASPIGDLRLTYFRETTGGQTLADKAVGPLQSNPADGHRLLAYVPLAAVIGVAIWAVGLIFLLVRMVHGWLAARRICRDATALDRDRFASLIEGVEKRFGLRRPLRIVVSDKLGTAAALGWLQQQIILPTSYVAQLGPEELESVLIHEMAHLLRRDHWIALLQRLAAVVYWPHPLVHVLNRQLARAREECCDNYVLQQLEPRRYAQLLLRLAEWPVSRMPPEPTLAFLTRRWKLEDRIADLLDAKRQNAVRPRRTFVVLAGTAIVAVVLASAGLRLTQASDKPATADATLPQTSPALAEAQITEKNPSLAAAAATAKEPVASAGALPPRMDLPGRASVQLGDLRFRTEARDLAFLPDGKTIISVAWGDGITYWDVATGRVKLHVRAKGDKMRMTADRKRLVTQDTDDREHISLQVWGAADGNHLADVKWPPRSPGASEVLQAVTADGKAVILSDREGQVTIRELATGRVLKERALSPREIEHIAVSPDGALLAISSDSNDLFLWEWQSANPPVELGPRRRYEGLAFSADGKRLAAGGDTKDEVRIFNVATHAIERSLLDPKGEPLLVHDLAFTPDGKRLVATNSIGREHDFSAGVMVWDIETSALVHRLSVSGAQPKRVALSADGKLVAAPMGAALRVWNLATGETVAGETTAHTAPAFAVCFSPNAKRIVTASDDGTARIWETATGRVLHQLDHESRWVRTATVSPDGALVATSGLDDKVRIWQMETGKPIHALQGHGLLGGWRALQFSPDGSVLYSWGDDNNLRVWDVASGQLKRAFALKRSGTHDGDPNREKTLPRGHVAELEEQCFGGCFRNGGNQLVLTTRNRYWIFDTSTGRETGTQAAPSVSIATDNKRMQTPISAIVCSDAGDRLLISSNAPFQFRKSPSGEWTNEQVGSGRLTMLELATGLPLWSTAAEAVWVMPIAVSPDGRFVAAGMGGPRRGSNGIFNGKIAIFDAKNGSRLRTIDGVGPLTGSHREAAFSPDSRRLAVAQTDGTVLIWDLAWLGLK